MPGPVRNAAIAAAMALTAAAAPAAGAADFYQGKQIRLIVATNASGAYDAYARLIAPFLAGKIPGHPSVVVQNMGGSGGLTAANYLAAAAPKDGTVIGAVESNIPVAPLFLPKNAKFKASDFAWIGSITSDPFIGYVWATSKLETYADAKRIPAIMGAAAARSYSAQMAQVSNVLFGTKFKIVLGYSGSDEVKLAMQRGEIDGTFGNAWSSLKSQDPEWIAQHKVRILTQFGLKRDPELADVPMFFDQAKTEADKRLLTLLGIPQSFAKPYLAPPGTPADRVAMLRKAFDETLKDPKFRAAVEKLHLSILDPLNGDALAAMIAKVSATSPAIIRRAKGILASMQTGRKP